jgi:HD-GYP domain-containing protein (c-di-GMP phosphodiesterase class II)
MMVSILLLMIYHSFSKLSLLWRFTLISLVFTLLIAGSLAFHLERNLRDDTLSAVAYNTADHAINILNKRLTAKDLNSPLQGERFAEINALIQDTKFNSDIVLIKLRNLDGLLVYTDEKSVLRQTSPSTDKIQEALEGKIATEISKLQDEENAADERLYNELFEIYVPIRPTDSSQIQGIYEIYYDISHLKPRLKRIRYTVWGGVGIAFILLYSTLFVIIRNASRELVQRNQEVQALIIAEHKERELSETLERVSRALSEILDLRRLLELICRESVTVFGTQAAFLWLLEGGELIGFSAYGAGTDKFIGMRFPIYDPKLLGARVARERKPILVNDAPNSRNVDQKMIELFNIKSMMGIPLMKGERLLGALMILDSTNPQRFNTDDLKTAAIFGSHAALAIDNAQLYERANLHLGHEKALREIDIAITSNLELNRTLQVVINQARRQLQVDACSILRLNETSQTLEFSNGLGFITDTIRNTHIQLGTGRAGNAVLERRTIGRAEIEAPEQISDRCEVLRAENFAAYFISPLVVKGTLLGALEIYHRRAIVPTAEWLKFFEALAGQTAIAIENATLFQNLQHTNTELRLAYDATIEGWSHALDLRDKETEGHTLRVTEMSVRLAKRMGLSEGEQIHVRRGALLHDIGKMGIPDEILHKAGILTENEWGIMRKHPQFAYEMLFPIQYLQGALDIPYCHHEKWDGTGYPRGLQGEQIPLIARIFTVVDVWDAITSDRPYRLAWSQDRALRHIRALSGSHFDPDVVEAFLNMLEEEPPLPSKLEIPTSVLLSE